MMWGMWNGPMSWWGMALGSLWMLAFWGGLIFLIVWAVRRSGSGPASRRGPLDIAKERYARGDLTREQFEELKQGLSK